MIKKFLDKLKGEGWTQEAIGERAGIPQTMISRYARGKDCNVETLIKIARAFNVSTDEVLGINQENTPPKANCMNPSLETRGTKNQRGARQ